MALIFYPGIDEPLRGKLSEKLDVLMEAAEQYKAIVLDEKNSLFETPKGDEDKRTIPRQLKAAFNWDQIAQVMREVRDIPETNPKDKQNKADYLMKLSEIYEVLRAAKMSKLEAVRLALMNESKQLRGQLPSS